MRMKKRTTLLMTMVLLLLTSCRLKNSEISRESLVQDSTTTSTIISEAKGRDEMNYVAGELIAAVEQSNFIQVQAILKDPNYDLNERNNRGESPLLIATHNNQIEIAKALIDAKADINLQDHIEDSPFLYAGAQGKTEILAYMLENSQPNQAIVNRYGGNALIPAAEKGHLKNVQLLLKEGSTEINHQNNFGYTALIEAVALTDGSQIYLEIVQELLKYQADKTLRDHAGKTAEDYAKELGYNHILAELQK